MKFDAKYPGARAGDTVAPGIVRSIWPKEACRVCGTLTKFVKEVLLGQVPVCSEECAEIRFACDCPPCPEGCEEPYCPEHKMHYADCPCKGPHSEDDDGS